MVPASQKETPLSPRAVRRSGIPTAPITRGQRPNGNSVATRYLPCRRPIRQNGVQGLPGALLGTFPAREKYPARGCGNPQAESLIKRHSEEPSSDQIPRRRGPAANHHRREINKARPVRTRRTGLAVYSRNPAGSTGSPSLATAKWRWAPRPASLREVLPTVPITVPALTSSPARTFVSGSRLA